VSLHKLGRTGLLFEESYKILQFLKEKNDWAYVKEKLYEEGNVSSLNRAYEIIIEIKHRFQTKEKFLPNINLLHEISVSNFDVKTKKEILFIYLCNKDEDFAKIVDDLRDITKNINFNPVITRENIKKLLISYKTATGSNPTKKAIDNWIGRFISILREVNLLIKKEFNTYLISFNNIQPNTWIFFSLHCFFQNIALHESPVFQIFHFQEDNLNQLFEYTNGKKLTYILKKDENQNNIINLETKYQNLLEWIIDQK
jgi:ribosome biogenesis protein Nip4